MAVAEGTSAGFVDSAPVADPEGAGTGYMSSYSGAGKFTSPAGSNAISEIGAYYNTSINTNFQVGIYSHDAGNNRPNALLASHGDQSLGASAGWKVGDVSYSLTASTTYWLATQADSTGGNPLIDKDTNAAYKYDYKAATALPAPWGASDATQEWIPAIYALYAAEGGASILPLVSFGSMDGRVMGGNANVMEG